MIAIPTVKQSPAHCGPACLQAVLAYYGITKTERELAVLAETSPEYGTSADKIVRTAKKLGLNAQKIDNADMNTLRTWVTQKKVPMIVAWFSTYEGHYSVVTKINDSHIFLMDPEHGKTRKMSHERFMGVWFDFRGPYLKKAEDIVLRRMIAIHPKVDRENYI